MASPIYLASLQLPLTEKPVMAFSAEQQLIYQDIFNLQNTFKIVLANFTEEAPDDGNSYVRQNKEWVAGGGGGGGIPEAPVDGKIYGRKDATWVEVSGGGGGGDKPELRLTGYTVAVDIDGTSITVQIPLTARAGDLLLLTGYARAALTVPPGWTLHTSVPYDSATSSQFQFLLYKAAVTADAGSNVTLSQAVSQRMGITALVAANAVIGDVKKGTFESSPSVVDPGPALSSGISILSVGVISQTTPGTMSCTDYAQLTPTSFNPLRNLTGFKYVNASDPLSSTITSGGSTYGWLVATLLQAD